MKVRGALLAGLVALATGFLSSAQSTRIQSIEQYDDLLPLWGISWKPGANSSNGYYPSFYTGFAMRVQAPERIHVRTSRGNQTRVTVILDEQTIQDYSFDLIRRYDFYRDMTKGGSAPLNTQPSGAILTPHLDYFNQIIESSQYDIQGFVQRATSGSETTESIYAKNLNLIRTLNPGRVRMINLNLKNEFGKWKQNVQQASNGNVDSILSKPDAIIVSINSLVLGRVNFEQKPDENVLAKLKGALQAAVNGAGENEFVAAAKDLFVAVTGSKYQIKVLNNKGQWQGALQCQSANSCYLAYPEFTTIYPTGSVESTTTDEFGNRINSFATPGLWKFIVRSGGRGVDNIRDEPYYGFIPKMDYQGIGNGFHNPAVRFYSPSKAVKQTLGLTTEHNTLWAVKRGGVSSGCLRLPAGSAWELRHIFPVEDEKMAQVSFFGNKPQDFDVFDIDGTGQPKVMGVEYFISYGLQGADGAAKREGTELEINEDKRVEFYSSLYGKKGVYNYQNEKFTFVNPRLSMPSYLDKLETSVSARMQLNGSYPLYEQKYEKDKLQFYAPKSFNKKMIRLMGRVRGCAPISDKKSCGQAAFESEMKGLVR